MVGDFIKTIATSRLIIRPVEKRDLALLLTWWNDGRVMGPVGAPDGLGVTADELEDKYWLRWKADPQDLMKIICLKSNREAIGETNFHHYNMEDKSVEIGLKICLPELWNQGYGTEALEAMVNYAFETLYLDRVLVNPAKTNAPIIHVNQKVGFRLVGKKGGGLLMEVSRKDLEM